jgi:hypothetical protein
MSNKIKKDDRAYLYFRENGKGGLNIKFGPDKYGEDTSKFSEILIMGNLKCVSFLSGLTIEEPLDTRMRQYENIKLTFSAIFDEAFPDVFQEKKRILGLEELAIERVESGDTVSPEFEKRVEEAKEEIKKRTNQNFEDKKESKQEEFKKNIEDKIQLLKETKERFLSKNHIDEEDLENEDRSMVEIIKNLISDEIEKLTKLYIEIEEGKAFMI